MNRADITKALIIYGVSLPLAVVLGYYLADPFSFSTIALVGLILFAIGIPFLIKYYHPLLFLTWNTTAILVLLPGNPPIWMLMAFVSILCVFLLWGTRVADVRILTDKQICYSLAYLFVVVLVTAFITGGLKFRVFGGEGWGGKRYLTVWAAIFGFFGLASRGVPVERAQKYVTLFFLGGITWVITSLYGIQSLRSIVYPLYYLFPVDPQATLSQEGLVFRVHGLPFASLFVWYWMVTRFGLRRIFTEQVWWRIPLVLLVLVGTMSGGFRLYLFTFIGIFFLAFYLEGLHKTAAVTVALLGLLILGCTTYAIAPVLPKSFQRSLAWLPVPVAPDVKYTAEVTTHWRVEMWKDLLRDVPLYFWKGRGLVFDPGEFELARTGVYKGPDAHYRAAYLAGDYHHGPLSVIIPLGVWGAIGFLWFTVASMRWVYRAWKLSPPELKTINSGILATYAIKMLVFYVFYGHFYQDFAFFTGLLGLSVSLNYRLLEGRT